MPKVLWKRDADAHDYPAAAAYLSLLISSSDVVDATIRALRDAEIAHYKAKDILRAAQLPLLAKTNPHVASDLVKVRKKAALSAVLLVRGNAVAGQPLLIADGYHRVCASVYQAENTDIPCRVVDLPTAAPARPVASTAAKAATKQAAKQPAKKAAAKKTATKKTAAKKTGKNAATRKAAAKRQPAKKAAAAPAAPAAPPPAADAQVAIAPQ
jgi:hypothetical protein